MVATSRPRSCASQRSALASRRLSRAKRQVQATAPMERGSRNAAIWLSWSSSSHQPTAVAELVGPIGSVLRSFPLPSVSSELRLRLRLRLQHQLELSGSNTGTYQTCHC